MIKRNVDEIDGMIDAYQKEIEAQFELLESVVWFNQLGCTKNVS